MYRTAQLVTRGLFNLFRITKTKRPLEYLCRTTDSNPLSDVRFFGLLHCMLSSLIQTSFFFLFTQVFVYLLISLINSKPLRKAIDLGNGYKPLLPRNIYNYSPSRGKEYIFFLFQFWFRCKSSDKKNHPSVLGTLDLNLLDSVYET